MRNFLKLFRVLCLVLMAGKALAADDITVTFQKNLHESKLKLVIADQFKKVVHDIRASEDSQFPEIGVQVLSLQTSRVDATALRVRAIVEAKPPHSTPNDVLTGDMTFILRFGCSGLNLYIPFTLESLIISVFDYPVEDIQRRINEQMRNLERKLGETLQRELPPPSRVRCPKIEIRSDVSIVMTVDLTPVQCIPPQTRQQSCSRNQWGDGILYTCANGYWKQQSRMCESCADSPHPSCPRRPRREF